mmetsp:Transcript_2576/g.6397  ORF Transcript_2576/g.6397 Transcript_2576/m.6397 type:complete len:974 (-) Transcript_2576:119-3040(-)
MLPVLQGVAAGVVGRGQQPIVVEEPVGKLQHGLVRTVVIDQLRHEPGVKGPVRTRLVRVAEHQALLHRQAEDGLDDGGADDGPQLLVVAPKHQPRALARQGREGREDVSLGRLGRLIGNHKVKVPRFHAQIVQRPGLYQGARHDALGQNLLQGRVFELFPGPVAAALEVDGDVRFVARVGVDSEECVWIEPALFREETERNVVGGRVGRGHDEHPPPLKHGLVHKLHQRRRLARPRRAPEHIGGGQDLAAQHVEHRVFLLLVQVGVPEGEYWRMRAGAQLQGAGRREEYREHQVRALPRPRQPLVLHPEGEAAEREPHVDPRVLVGPDLVVQRRVEGNLDGFLRHNFDPPIVANPGAAHDSDAQRVSAEHARPPLREARHLELQVPGLAEGRPSVLRGDSLRVTVVGGARVGYNGRVEVVTQKSVKIAFHASLYDKVRTNKDTRVNVRFSFSRLPLRVQYQGLAWARKRADLMLPVLFPSPSTLQLRSSAHSPVFTFRNANLNEEQKHAVFHMLRREVLAAPYVLWGPPGTGKTTTLVEFVYQAVLQGWRVLVVAPSNSATDNIALRLLSEKCGLDPDALLRVYSHSRNESDIPVDLKRCSNWTGKEFENPPLKEILSKRVVACTLIKAGTLYNLGVEAGHFDFVVADEASQATEADILAPLATLSGKGTRLVLGGDHKQLGAIVSSPIVQPILGLSMQERLMLRDAYQSGADGSFDPRFVTELVDNYRSHEAMLELPNRLFYDNRLLPTADYARSHSLQDWEHLPTQGFPMVFEGVDGEDERELSSPSWFNRMEALAVKEWVEKLIESDVDPKSIGIITPYAKQVQKIRMLLKAHDLGGVDVGSTEIFQGQERRVIIISTVRSTEELLDQDVKHRLGFVANPRRFNVAVTRAQALLVVVGDPKVLYHDKYWGELLRYCRDRGAYKGESLEGIEKAEKDDDYDAWEDQHLISSSVGLEGNRDDHEGPSWSRDG